MSAKERLESGTMDVTIKKKSKVHTNITVIENATRYA
jgi:hypothetical protein